MEKGQLRIIKTNENEEENREKMIETEFKKTEQKKKEKNLEREARIRERTIQSVREYKGFHNGGIQTREQNWEHSEGRDRKRAEASNERQQHKQEQEKSEPAGLQTSSMGLFVLLFVCSFK